MNDSIIVTREPFVSHVALPPCATIEAYLPGAFNNPNYFAPLPGPSLRCLSLVSSLIKPRRFECVIELLLLRIERGLEVIPTLVVIWIEVKFRSCVLIHIILSA